MQGLLSTRLSLFHGGRGLAPAPAPAGAPSVFDMRPGLLWLVPGTVIYFLGSAVYVCVVVMHRLGASHRSFGRVGGFCYGLQGVPFEIAAGIDIGAGRWAAGLPFLVRGAIPVAFGLLLCFAEPHFVYWLAPFGAAQIAVDMAIVFALEGGASLPVADLLLSPFADIGAIAVVFGLTCLALRRHFLAKAAALVLEDRTRYQQLWLAVLREEGSRSALARLQSLAGPFENRGNPRQLCPEQPAPQPSAAQQGPVHLLRDVETANGSASDGAASSLDGWQLFRSQASWMDRGVGRVVPLHQPVTCLDQLTAQAQARARPVRESR